MLITENILRNIAETVSQMRAVEIVPLLNYICPQYGISDKSIFEDFLPELLHESNEFNTFSEGMNYQAVALTLKFSRKRISIDDCYRYGRTMKQAANQQAIANCLYGGEWGSKNLGNTKPGDGWALRGSGAIQQTGEFMIGGFAQYYNKMFGTSYNTYQMAELLRKNLSICIHGACWVFAISKALIDEAKADKVIEIREKINGGRFGLDKILKYTDLCKKYL